MTRIRARRLVLAVVATLAMGLLAACGGDGDESSSPTDETLRLGYPLTPYKFDPATSFGGDRIWLKLIYDPLIELDAETLEPLESGRRALAESWGFTDDLTFNIKLREGVTFQDGEPLTAEAVKKSVERYQDLSLVAFYRLPTLAGIEVVNDLELNFTLSSPDASLPTRLYGEVGMIVSPAAIDASYEDLSATPIGTGPYSMSEFVAGSKVVLERNDDYWGEAPGYKTMDFTIYPSTVAMVQAFQAGQLDFMTRVPFSDVAALENNANATIEVTPTLADGSLALATVNPNSPFHDVRVRNAIDLALDRVSINELATEGYGSPTQQPYPEDYQLYYEDGEDPEERDVDEARRLVEQVYPDGVDVNCVTYTGSYFESAVPELINQFGEIGIDLSIEVLTLNEVNTKYNAGEVFCNFRQLTSQFPPDVAMIARLGANSADGAQTDPAQLIDQSLLEDLRLAVGQDELQDAVGAVWEAAEETDTVIPIFTRPEAVVLGPSVDGYVPNLANWDLSTLKPKA